jgi:DnaJ-class molecular chaperone
VHSPFAKLGLAPGATPDQVKQAWRRLAAIYHPDKGGDGAKFHELRLAYEAALVQSQLPKVCSRCNGSGKTEYRNGFSSIMIVCSLCNGIGETA